MTEVPDLISSDYTYTVWSPSEEVLEASAWNPPKRLLGPIGPYFLYASENDRVVGAMQYLVRDRETLRDVMEIDSYSDPFFVIRTPGTGDDVFERFDSSVDRILNIFKEEVMAWPQYARWVSVFPKEGDAELYSYTLDDIDLEQQQTLFSFQQRELDSMRFNSPVGAFTFEFSPKVRIGYLSPLFATQRSDIIATTHQFILETNPSIDPEALAKILLVLKMDSNQLRPSPLSLPSRD